MCLEVEGAEIGLMVLVRLKQEMREVDHEKSEVGGIGHALLGQVHEIFQAPMLFGIAEVELNLKAQAIVAHHFLGTQIAIRAEQHDVSALAGFEMGFDDDHDVEPTRYLR